MNNIIKLIETSERYTGGAVCTFGTILLLAVICGVTVRCIVVDTAAIKSGLVQKKVEGSNTIYWTKP